MKKIVAVFAGIAFSSLCVAAPIVSTTADANSDTTQGGMSTDMQGNTKAGSGMSLGTQTQGSVQQSEEASTAIFAALDQNGDGALDENEAKSEQALSQYFVAIDTNADGKVSPEEYTLRRQAVLDHKEEAE